jgi:hypothetical protein
MKIVFLAIMLIFSGYLIKAETPSRLIDGKIEFVNPETLELTYPMEEEVNVSTCVYHFENYSDYLSCFTKAGISIKISEIRKILNDMEDVQDDPKYIDLNERIQWLKSYRQGLND